MNMYRDILNRYYWEKKTYFTIEDFIDKQADFFEEGGLVEAMVTLKTFITKKPQKGIGIKLGHIFAELKDEKYSSIGLEIVREEIQNSSLKNIILTNFEENNNTVNNPNQINPLKLAIYKPGKRIKASDIYLFKEVYEEIVEKIFPYLNETYTQEIERIGFELFPE